MKNMEEELKRLRNSPQWNGVWTVALFGALLVCVTAGFARLQPIHWLWLIPVMGWVQYYIVISGHEAVHKTLCPSKKLNEAIGIVGQAMIGVNFTAYRLQHMDHHRTASYESDPDAHIYIGVMKQAPGWRRFLWLTMGTFIEILIKIRQKGVEGYGTKRKIKSTVQKDMRRDSLLVILCQLGWMSLGWYVLNLHQFVPIEVLDVFTTFGMLGEIVLLGAEFVFSYAVFWTIPLFCITVFLNRCRIVIEHGLALALVHDIPDFNGPRIPTVEVHPSRLERWVFAPFMFSYHGSHHAYMTVPHYHLPELNRIMKERFSSPNNPVGFLTYPKGYLQALFLVVNHPYTLSPSNQ